MNKTEEQAGRLVAFLLQLKKIDNRGTLADLRCGFSAAKAYRAWPHIAPFCKLDQDWSRIPVQTVCAAFATHPEHAKCGNLGATMRRIEMATIEGRFQRLISCDTVEELCERIPSIIRAAKTKGIPLDYDRLYSDICWWTGKYPPKLKWADAFWGTSGGKQ